MEKLARTRTGGSPGAATLTTKRKLDFSTQQQEKESRLPSAKGRCFYLDLVGRDDLVARYQQELTRRGAVVAQFFDKCVEVLVTNRSGSGKSGGRLSGSPATNPSPALGSLSRQSPFSNSPRTSIESSNGNLALSRGKMALEMAKKRGQKSGQNDLVTKATDWGTKVWTITKLEEYLLATKGNSSATKDRKQSKTGSGIGRGTPKVRALKAPFVKVEDMSRAYKPLVFEVKAWPTPNVHCSPEDSPFDSPPPRKDKAKRQAEKPTHPTPAMPKQPVVPLDNKPGYCECCKAHFKDVKMHLQGEQHLAFATNAQNYAGLDELISQGTSFDDFLSKYAKVKTAESQRLRQKTPAPGNKVAVSLQLEQTPGFVTPITVSGAKRPHPTSSSSNSRNSPKRLKLVLSPSSLPERTAGADSGVCLQPDSRCKSPVKECAVSSDVGQSPVLRSGRRLKKTLPSSNVTDETPIPVSAFDLTIVVADVSPVRKELAVVLSQTTPCSQASTVSVTPRIDTASSASTWYQPSRRKSLRHLARKLQNSSVSPDADWKQEQKAAFQVSQTLSSSVQSTPTRPIVRSVQASPQSGFGSVSCMQRNTTETESNNGKRQMPSRRCKKLSPPTVAVTPKNRRSRRRRR